MEGGDGIKGLTRLGWHTLLRRAVQPGLSARTRACVRANQHEGHWGVNAPPRLPDVGAAVQWSSAAIMVPPSYIMWRSLFMLAPSHCIEALILCSAIRPTSISRLFISVNRGGINYRLAQDGCLILVPAGRKSYKDNIVMNWFSNLCSCWLTNSWSHFKHFLTRFCYKRPQCI